MADYIITINVKKTILFFIFPFLGILGIYYFFSSEKTDKSNNITVTEAQEEPVENKIIHDDSPSVKALSFNTNYSIQNDLSFLKGTWLSDPISFNSDKPTSTLIIEYNFDGSGIGKKTITDKNGLVCNAKVEAYFLDDGRLSIRDIDSPQCSDKTSFVRSVTLCTKNNNGDSDCIVDQIQGGSFPVKLYRDKEDKKE